MAGETEEDRSNEVVRRFIVVETFSNIALFQTRRHLNLLSFDQIGGGLESKPDLMSEFEPPQLSSLKWRS